MADTKITALTALTGADPANDVIPIVDVSDTTMAASGTTKKISVNNILGASGTATLASATITGDLTVDTNVLKVDTTNNRVGVNTASPIDALHVVGSARLGSTNFIGIGADASGSYVESTVGTHVLRFNTTGSERYRLDSTGVATWSNVGGVAGTAMTLNANGLGIGVTPSAWGAGYKALQLGNGLSLMGSPLNGTIAGNAWFDGTNWKYITANPATLYYASFGANGSHVWSISSGVPSAGGTVSLTNAMTLDASGNLSLQSDKHIGWGNLDSLIYGSSTSNYIYFRTNTIERVRVKGGGQLRFIPLAADPAGAEAGDVYYNSSSNKLKCYNGTTWNDLF